MIYVFVNIHISSHVLFLFDVFVVLLVIKILMSVLVTGPSAPSRETQDHRR
jgi:hypothetical protein